MSPDDLAKARALIAARDAAEHDFETKGAAAHYVSAVEASKALKDWLGSNALAILEHIERVERNRDMWKGQCERQAERLTVLNHAVAEISRGVQSGVDPQASIERLVTIARNAAPEIVSSELPAAQTLKERNDG